MTMPARLRWRLNDACDRINRATEHRPGILRWQRERFLANAARFTPVIGTDDHRGNRYYLRTDDPWIGRALFLDGSYEPEKLDAALSVMDRLGISPTRVLDIGANIGTTTIELLSRMPDVSAVAFEPEPVNFTLLSQNVIANGLQDRVALHQVALSDRDGAVELEIAADNPGDHRVRTRAAESGQLGESSRATRLVPGRRLDALIDSGDVAVDASTLVCIDVQGHEAHVLAGATKLLDARVPITFEFWPYGLRRAGRLEEFMSCVTSYGTLFDIGVDPPRRVSAEAFAHRAGDAHHGAFSELMVVPES
jgi:FkbM family methyltransferase